MRLKICEEWHSNNRIIRRPSDGYVDGEIWKINLVFWIIYGTLSQPNFMERIPYSFFARYSIMAVSVTSME